MNIARKILIAFAGFICVMAISITLYLLTAQTTVMDRTVVKTWLQDSNIYDGKLISALVESTTPPAEQQTNTTTTSTITPDKSAIKTALGATFTPDFVRAQAEKTIDSAYDYAEGKTSEFNVSIPLNEKRDTIIQQLAKAIEPQIAALPVCTVALVNAQTACRPPNESIPELAQKLTTENIDKSELFNKPLTNETFTKNKTQTTEQAPTSPLTQLPKVFSGIKLLLVVVPIVAMISFLIILFVTTKGDRLLAVSGLSKRIFFGTIITFAIAVIVVFVARTNDFGAAGLLPGQIGNAVAPLIQQVVSGISFQLALFSGIVCAVTLAGWIGFMKWHHRSTQTAIVNSETQAAKVQTTVPPTEIQSPDSKSTDR